MEIEVLLTDLTTMHPRLIWEDIILAAAAVLESTGLQNPVPFDLTVQDLPDFGNGQIRLVIDPGPIAPDVLARFRRTYDSSRLIELAAIAIAGLGLYHGGGHEMRDVALRGSAADYLVDEAGCLLEVAGRSRRSDLTPAWENRWTRLSERFESGFYVCVAEFETPAGRLAFAP